MNKLMITMACLATAVGGSLYAQDPKPAAENTAAAAKATTEKTATKAPDLVAMAKEASRDGGQSIVDKAVEKAPEMNAVKATPQEDAAAVVERKLAAGKLSEGYNRQEKAIIQIGVGSIRIEDPINDKTFMIAREGLALYAYLNAKANVLRAINTEFSAIDRMMTIAEFGEDMTAQKYAAKKAELESRRDVLAKMLKDAEALTAEEADSVKEVTISDRLGAFIDAVIKKIDATYDPKVLESKHLQLSAERKAKIAKLRSECDALLKDYQQLEADAANLGKDPTLETSSDVKMLSQMPLLGSSVLTQAETWDPEEKVFSVAMALVWSPKLQEQAISMISDDFKHYGKPGKYTIQEWVNAQEFSHMVGARRFTDKEGMNLFVGVSAVDLKLPVVKQNAAKMLADSMAMKGVAFSLAGDLVAYREASQNLKVYENESKGATAKLRDEVQAQVTLNLHGCMRLAGKTVMHPLLNRKIYVSAYYIDPALAKEAQGYMKKLFIDAGVAAKLTNQKRAYTLGAQQMLARIRNEKVEPIFMPTPKVPPLAITKSMVGGMNAEQKKEAKAAVEAEEAKLDAEKRVIVEQAAKVEAEKRAAQELEEKERLARQQKVLEMRKRKIEEDQRRAKEILTYFYVGEDTDIPTLD